MLFPSGRIEIDSLLAEIGGSDGLSIAADPIGLEALRVLTSACEVEARLSLFGRFATRFELRRLLENCRALDGALRSDPAIAARPIRSPLFITGLPRSGTTFLHELLAADPANRAPLSWEVMYPPSSPRARLRTQHLYWWTERLAPSVRAIHPLEADKPQECIAIMAPSFLSYQFQAAYRVPTYQAWLERQDLRSAYRHHRLMLQWLQGQDRQARWIFKAPAHLFGLEALLAIYPDATVVQLHRDPIDAVASVSSMTAAFRRVFSRAVDAAEIGREQAALWARGLEQAMRFRAENADLARRFHDVHFRALVREPLAIVERVYDAAGWALSDAARRAMQVLLDEATKRRTPTHRYGANEYGLDQTIERRRFAAYIERFGISAES